MTAEEAKKQTKTGVTTTVLEEFDTVRVKPSGFNVGVYTWIPTPMFEAVLEGIMGISLGAGISHILLSYLSDTWRVLALAPLGVGVGIAIWAYKTLDAYEDENKKKLEAALETLNSKFRELSATHASIAKVFTAWRAVQQQGTNTNKRTLVYAEYTNKLPLHLRPHIRGILSAIKMSRTNVLERAKNNPDNGDINLDLAYLNAIQQLTNKYIEARTSEAPKPGA